MTIKNFPSRNYTSGFFIKIKFTIIIKRFFNYQLKYTIIIIIWNKNNIFKIYYYIIIFYMINFRIIFVIVIFPSINFIFYIIDNYMSCFLLSSFSLIDSFLKILPIISFTFSISILLQKIYHSGWDSIYPYHYYPVRLPYASTS